MYRFVKSHKVDTFDNMMNLDRNTLSEGDIIHLNDGRAFGVVDLTNWGDYDGIYPMGVREYTNVNDSITSPEPPTEPDGNFQAPDITDPPHGGLPITQIPPVGVVPDTPEPGQPNPPNTDGDYAKDNLVDPRLGSQIIDLFFDLKKDLAPTVTSIEGTGFGTNCIIMDQTVIEKHFGVDYSTANGKSYQPNLVNVHAMPISVPNLHHAMYGRIYGRNCRSSGFETSMQTTSDTFTYDNTATLTKQPHQCIKVVNSGSTLNIITAYQMALASLPSSQKYFNGWVISGLTADTVVTAESLITSKPNSDSGFMFYMTAYKRPTLNSTDTNEPWIGFIKFGGYFRIDDNYLYANVGTGTDPSNFSFTSWGQPNTFCINDINTSTFPTGQNAMVTDISSDFGVSSAYWGTYGQNAFANFPKGVPIAQINLTTDGTTSDLLHGFTYPSTNYMIATTWHFSFNLTSGSLAASSQSHWWYRWFKIMNGNLNTDVQNGDTIQRQYKGISYGTQTRVTTQPAGIYFNTSDYQGSAGSTNSTYVAAANSSNSLNLSQPFVAGS